VLAVDVGNRVDVDGIVGVVVLNVLEMPLDPHSSGNLHSRETGSKSNVPLQLYRKI